MILGIIQARMNSKRLPGKVLKEINGKPLLSYLYERVASSKLIDKVAIATSSDKSSLPIVKFAERHKIDVFAGSENDLTDRLYMTVKTFGGDTVVRITGDCPLVDPEVIDKIVRFYLDNEDKYDFVSNTVKPTYPDGLDAEVFPFSTIEKAYCEIKDPFWREWVTSYILEHPETYRIGNVENDRDLSNLRWTVDYKEDFDFAASVFRELYPKKKRFLMKDILQLLEREPHLREINKVHGRNINYYEEKERAGK